MQNIWRLLRLIPNHKARIGKVFLISTLIGLLNVTFPYLYKLIIDTITGLTDAGQAVQTIALLFGGIALGRLLIIALQYWQERVSDSTWMEINWSIRGKIYDHLSRVSLDYFERTRTGEIMSRIGSIMQLNRWFYSLAEGVLINIIQTVFILILLTTISPVAGMVMLFVVPYSLANALKRTRQTKPIRKEWMQEADKASGLVNEMISNISTVRSFGAEREILSRWSQVIEGFKVIRMKEFRVEWNSNAWRNSVQSLAVVAALAVVTFDAIYGRATTGDIFAVSLYLSQLLNGLMPISRIIVQTGEVETTAERILEVLDTPALVLDKADAQELNSIDTIEFKNVSFSYPESSQKILENISFQLATGQTLALVGRSGVGKTTITKLLLRFYDATEGQILINGRDIRDYSQDSLRSHIGMVMQDVALFNESVEENLRIAAPTAKLKDLKRAAVLAHADAFIEKLPKKYKALVGERGVKLSGGEKQRMAIARAILKNPQLIILDEATSALDSESEQHVQAGLEELMKGRTAVIIAHRLSTIMKADKILVIDNGKVIQSGTHDELLTRKRGLYAKLYQLQMGGVIS